MGGHIVLGHVDGVGRVSARERRVGDALRLEVTRPGGARAASSRRRDRSPSTGVSLTVNRVGAAGPGGVAFDVMLVPHTLGAHPARRSAARARG